MADQFHRVKLLTGQDGFDRLARGRVLLFGVGGVGSWAAEALVRTGIGTLTMVDPDTVAVSNINRQLPALHSTVGQPKVEVMRRRMLDINPCAMVEARQEMYTADNADDFGLENYDYVIDAIDSLSDKASLILHATSLGAGTRLVSAMGAALKSDPTRIRTAEFWQVKGCPLARALRQRFKRLSKFPGRKFQCVYSDELLPNHEIADDTSGAMSFNKAVTNGALVPVTATAGMTLAALVINGLLGSRD